MNILSILCNFAVFLITMAVLLRAIRRDGQWDRNGTRGWRRSTNGTYVNSSEVNDNGLDFAPGDIISVGDTKLRVEGY